jgi:hypothetical protein
MTAAVARAVMLVAVFTARDAAAILFTELCRPRGERPGLRRFDLGVRV